MKFQFIGLKNVSVFVQFIEKCINRNFAVEESPFLRLISSIAELFPDNSGVVER